MNELDRALNELLGGRRRKIGGSSKLVCVECGVKITRAQRRESVHCAECVAAFNKPYEETEDGAEVVAEWRRRGLIR